MKQQNKTVVIIFISWLIAACSYSVSSPVLTITQSSLTATTLPSSPTTNSIPRRPAPPTSVAKPIISTPLVAPTAFSTPYPTISAPSGLIYAKSGTWMIGVDGKPSLISSQPFAILSPNRQMILYDERDVIWISNLVTGEVTYLSEGITGFGGEYGWSSDGQFVFYEKGEDIWVADSHGEGRHNLTNTPDREEYMMSIWYAQPNVIRFYSQAQDGIGGEGWFGYPTTIRLDGTQYTILTDLPSTSVALSPDGRSIAVADDNRTWLYDIELGKISFPLAKYGLDDTEIKRLASPTWSPDGKRMTWWAQIHEENRYYWDLMLVDLPTGATQNVGRFTPYSYGLGDPDAPEWSPNSQWFSFWSGDEGYENVGIWVANGDGKEAKLLVDFGKEYEHDITDRIWSPTSKWLSFTSIETGWAVGIWLANPETGQLSKTDIPDSAHLWGWINTEPLQVGKVYAISEKGANLNVHGSPSVNGSIVTKLHSGEVILPLEGPVDADRYSWWRIRADASGTEGWIVDIQDWYAPIK